MDDNEERFALNWYSEFKNKEVETEYREYEKTTSLKTIRALILVYGLIYALFAISDYVYYVQDSPFIVLLGFRGLALLVTLSAFFMAPRFKRYNHTLLMITIVELLICVIILYHLYIQGNADSAMHFKSIMLLILAVFLIPNLWKNSMMASLIILISYIFFSILFVEQPQSPPINQMANFLGIGLSFCAFAIYGRERSQRRHYAAEKLMEHMIITDRLTGIYNRGRFEYIIDLWIKNMRHYPFCLILFDIDNFKKVNDQYGHSVGDQVLIETANIVKSHIRDTDIFARWGGEEFVVLFSGVSINLGMELAERLRHAVEENDTGKAGKITISIGVAEYRRGETVLDLVERTDAKMYEAKRAGRNKVVGDFVMPEDSIL